MEDYKQPLVKALRFPNLVVRIRAALALGAALPRTGFADSQFVVPVLTTALSQTGREFVLVVEPDESRRNMMMEGIRSAGHEVIGEVNFFEGLHRARTEAPALSAVIVSADIREPDLREAMLQFRAEYVYTKTPVVLLEASGQALTAQELADADEHAESIDAHAAFEDIQAAIDKVRERTGQAQLDDDLALSLGLEAAATLRAIAVDGRTVYDFGMAEAALIGALSADDEGLRITAASVLALAATRRPSGPSRTLRWMPANTESLRVAVFGSLAESAKGCGNLLEAQQIDELVRISREDENLTIRTAAQQGPWRDQPDDKSGERHHPQLSQRLIKPALGVGFGYSTSKRKRRSGVIYRPAPAFSHSGGRVMTEGAHHCHTGGVGTGGATRRRLYGGGDQHGEWRR